MAFFKTVHKFYYDTSFISSWSTNVLQSVQYSTCPFHHWPLCIRARNDLHCHRPLFSIRAATIPRSSISTRQLEIGRSTNPLGLCFFFTIFFPSPGQYAVTFLFVYAATNSLTEYLFVAQKWFPLSVRLKPLLRMNDLREHNDRLVIFLHRPHLWDEGRGLDLPHDPEKRKKEERFVVVLTAVS